MKKIIIPVSGMHCRSCELLLEKLIQRVSNVDTVDADQKKGLIEISYTDSEPDREAIDTIIIENGYQLGNAEKLPWITKNSNDYRNIFVAFIIVYILYILASQLGWTFGNVGNTTSPTIGIVFLIGLTAGVSSCMALIGGLVLGISSKWNKDHAQESLGVRFSPHIYFHMGRIIGFGLLGGLLGLFGSIIHFSNIFLGIMTALVGIIMLILGLNLTNLSPRIGSFSPTLPKMFGKNIKGDANTKISTFITGALTFFLPCGFTLAMQLYAVSTGSFMTGAIILIFFALGTVPGLISIGIVSAMLKGEWLKKFFVFTGVILLGLGIFNFNNGYALLILGGTPGNVIRDINNDTLEVQEVYMTQGGNGYSPSTISIDAGKKIRWIITGTNPYSCASQLIAPAIGVSKQMKEGENIIEFVAPLSGEVPFSCSMGMYRGKFIIKN